VNLPGNDPTTGLRTRNNMTKGLTMISAKIEKKGSKIDGATGRAHHEDGLMTKKPATKGTIRKSATQKGTYPGLGYNWGKVRRSKEFCK